MTSDAERDVLQSYLSAQRRHVLGIVEGLSDEAMRRPVLPSGWSCVGMLSHLAHDIERFWFQAVVAADPEVIRQMSQHADVWQVADDIAPAVVVQAYRDAVAASDVIVTATPADASPGWWPGDQFGDFRLVDLREILLHVIVETACHAGHLDAVRELVDGRTWLVLTD